MDTHAVTPAAPDLLTFHVIHRAMRTDARRLEVAVSSATEADRDGRLRAVARWYAGFLAELHAHHTVEDEVFFPSLEEKVPAFADHADRLHRDHVHLGDALARVELAVGSLTGGGADWPAAIGEATDATTGLRDLLDHHLGFEDAEIVPMFARHFTAAEYEAVEDRASKMVNVRTLPFAIPWIGEAATDEEKVRLLGSAPLAFRLLWYATRRRYARLSAAALGPVPRAAA
jgi:hemerythrin-like domain-containing protein